MKFKKTISIFVLLFLFLNVFSVLSVPTVVSGAAAPEKSLTGGKAYLCLSSQRCLEIDEVWAKLVGMIIRGSTDVWDTNTGSWKPFEEMKPSVSVGETCLDGMKRVKDSCMDIYEAPNVKGVKPLVMYTLPGAQAWCESKGKRLCYDDEWVEACSGSKGLKWPYGNDYIPGKCHDDKSYRTHDQSLLNKWSSLASTSAMESWEEQLAVAKSKSPEAAEHMEFLYQGDPSGSRENCVNEYGIYDLSGNVEEWTLRRDGGEIKPVKGIPTQFSGNLEGRHWAHGDQTYCNRGVKSHADMFRFYEVGFRCCANLGTVSVSPSASSKTKSTAVGAPSSDALLQAIKSLDEVSEHEASCCGDWLARVYKWTGYNYRYYVVSYSSLDQLAEEYGYPVGYNDDRNGRNIGHALILLGFGSEAEWWLQQLQGIEVSGHSRSVSENEALVISYSGGSSQKVRFNVYPRGSYPASLINTDTDSPAKIVHAHPWDALCEGSYESDAKGKYWSRDQSGEAWSKYWEPVSSPYYPSGDQC